MRFEQTYVKMFKPNFIACLLLVSPISIVIRESEFGFYEAIKTD